jgi:hypothetical protein
LLLSAQLIELGDDFIGFAARAFVSPDGFNQAGCASIVKEEDPLPDAPKRSGSELVRASAAWVLDPLTVDNSKTRYVAGEFGAALLAVSALIAIYFWRRRDGVVLATRTA